MQKKKQLYGPEGVEHLLIGINKMANAVGSTLGPQGRNVLIQDEYGSVRSTKDGFTVAKELELMDNLENVGARILREVSMKTNEIAGDGTTTSTVLAQSIINLGFDAVNNGIDGIVVKRQIEDYVDNLCTALDGMSLPIDIKSEYLEAVASIAANNDIVLGNLLAHAFREVGESGIVTVVEGRGLEDSFEHSEGISFNRGYTSSSFVNNEAVKAWESNNVMIIFIGEKITNADDLFSIIEAGFAETVITPEKNFLIICDDIDEKIQSLLILNKMKGLLNVCIVKGPGHNLDRRSLMTDLAVMTGGTILSNDSITEVRNGTAAHYGFADSVKVDFNTTTIIGGKKNQAIFDLHVENLKSQIEVTKEEFAVSRLQERIARLNGGIGVIYAGGASPFEIKEKMDRLNDAVHALKGAMEEGILPGGGVALIHASKNIEDMDDTGEEIMKQVIESPLRKMLENAGIIGNEADIIVDDVYNTDTLFGGYDLKNKIVNENMISGNVIDVTKVVKSALINAASVASLFLTTEYIIVNCDYKSDEY